MRKKKTECTRQMRKTETVCSRTGESEKNIDEKCTSHLRKINAENILDR